MRYLTPGELLMLYRAVMEQTGGAYGIRDLGALEAALAQPRMTFDGVDLYPTLVEKASALGYSLVMNHPFVDGNKRTGHLAMETFLVLNDHELNVAADEQEATILQLASGVLSRQAFTEWIRKHVAKM